MPGPVAEAPAIDLTAVTVAAAFAGEKPSAGHSIDISAADARRTRGVTLAVEERGPGRGMVAAAIITSPFHIVAVPRGLEVTWASSEVGRPEAGGSGKPRRSLPTSDP